MTCANLFAFCDGELSASEADAFRSHLAHCETCQRQIADDMELRARLSQPRPMTIEATISVCANGHDVYAIMLNDFRLFGGKCCGRWTVVRRYTTTPAELREDLGEAVPDLIGAAPALSAEERVTAGWLRELASVGDAWKYQLHDPDVAKHVESGQRAVALLDRLLEGSKP